MPLDTSVDIQQFQAVLSAIAEVYRIQQQAQTASVPPKPSAPTPASAAVTQTVVRPNPTQAAVNQAVVQFVRSVTASAAGIQVAVDQQRPSQPSQPRTRTRGGKRQRRRYRACSPGSTQEHKRLRARYSSRPHL